MQLLKKSISMALAAAFILGGILLSETQVYAVEAIEPVSQDLLFDPETEEPGEVLPLEGEYVISDDDPEGTVNLSWRAISFYTVDFYRLSSISAKAAVEVKATTSVKSVESTIYLQRKNTKTGKYVTVTGSKRTNVEKGRTLSHKPTYSISFGQKYRIKSVVYDGTTYIVKHKVL